jgi:uncharacterized protein GlcG (DUF336 family)
MTKLTLAQANTIIDVALKKGQDAKMKPLSVAVLDAGGNLIAFKKSDNSSVMRFEVAYGKAYGAIGMGMASRNLETMALQRPHFANALAAASGGKVIPVAGGILVKDKDGDVIGAVGVTGDTSDNDELAAKSGVEAAGLATD